MSFTPRLTAGKHNFTADFVQWDITVFGLVYSWHAESGYRTCMVFHGFHIWWVLGYSV